MARLKAYRENLIIFPRGSKHLPKKGDSSLEEQAAATQVSRERERQGGEGKDKRAVTAADVGLVCSKYRTGI